MKKVASLILKIIGWFLVVVGALSLIARIIFPVFYSQDYVKGSIFGAIITFFIGYALREWGYKLGKKPTISDKEYSIALHQATLENKEMENENNILANNPIQPKQKKRIQWKKIFASIALTGVFGYCVGCVDEHDSLTAWMIIVYIPYFLFLYAYYIRAIWKYGREITKEQILLLPVLQRINILKDYSNLNPTDKIRLFNTTFYGLVLSVLCPAIVSTMYYDMGHHIGDYYGLCYCLLSLPIMVWSIGIMRGKFQNWFMTTNLSIKLPEQRKGVEQYIAICESLFDTITNYRNSCKSLDDFINNDAQLWVQIRYILKNLNVIGGYRPSITYIHAAFEGYYPTYILKDPADDCIEAPNKKILSVLNRKGDDFKAFIWESYLFLNLYRLLGWVTNDAIFAAMPVFSYSDIDKIGIKLPALEKLKTDGVNFEPQVLSTENTAIINCYWWAPLKGLYQETCTFNYKNNLLHLLSEEKEIIVLYNIYDHIRPSDEM